MKKKSGFQSNLMNEKSYCDPNVGELASSDSHCIWIHERL